MHYCTLYLIHLGEELVRFLVLHLRHPHLGPLGDGHVLVGRLLDVHLRGQGQVVGGYGVYECECERKW